MIRLLLLLVPVVAFSQVPAVVPPPKTMDEFWPWLIAGLVGIYLQPLAMVARRAAPEVQTPCKARPCPWDAEHPPALEGAAEKVADVHAALHYTDAEGNTRRVLSGERRRLEDAATAKTHELLSEMVAEQRKLVPAIDQSLRMSAALAKRFLVAEERNEEAVRMLERETT